MKKGIMMKESRENEDCVGLIRVRGRGWGSQSWRREWEGERTRSHSAEGQSAVSKACRIRQCEQVLPVSSNRAGA